MSTGYNNTTDITTIDHYVSFAKDIRIFYFKSENSRIIEKAIRDSAILSDYIRGMTKENNYLKDNYWAVLKPEPYINYFNKQNPAPPVLYLKNSQHYSNLFLMLTEFLEKEYYKNSVLLLSSPYISIPNGMEDSILLLDIKPPNLDDIRIFIDQFAKSHSFSFSTENTTKIAQNMAGFSEQQVQNILQHHYLYSSNSSERLNDISNIIELAVQERQEQMLKDPNIQLDRDPAMAQGLTMYNEWLDENIPQLIDYKEEGLEYGLYRPKGVLLLGLPGTGKTEMARITRNKMSRKYSEHMGLDGQKEFDTDAENTVPLILLNLHNLTSSNYGESEKKLVNYLERIDAMAPAIVMIDEIDKTFVYDPTGQHQMHEVTQSLMRTLLSWMQGQKQSVFCYFAANSAAKLPPELLRDGRLSERFFVFLPTQAELNDIINSQLCSLQAKLSGKNLFEDDLLKSIGYDSDKHTYYKNTPSQKIIQEEGRSDFGLNLLNDAVRETFANNKDAPSRRKKIFMTGANTAKLIDMTMRKLKREKTTRPYSLEVLRKTILEILLSPDFIPYGESNIEQIVELWLYTYTNRYRCVSDRYIPDPEEYDNISGEFRSVPGEEDASKDYNTYMDYTLKKAIKFYVQTKHPKGIQ